MIDSHLHPETWGVMPVLFSFGSFKIPAYEFFVLLGLIVGLGIYFYESKNQKRFGKSTIWLLVAALVGGVLGAKIPIWIWNYKLIISTFPDLSVILSGRTITGGLIGGFIGVVLAKKYFGIKERRGNIFAPAIALGVAIGRIGCFLRGCCFGKETALAWAVDFGDGIMRHPTQIYESIFMLGLFFYLIWKKKKNPKPGQLFDILMISYFTFRFFIEFIRVEPVAFLGLTWFQLVSVVVVGYFVLKRFIKSD